MRSRGLAVVGAAVAAAACSPTGNDPGPVAHGAAKARAEKPAEIPAPEAALVQPAPRAATSLAIAVDQSASVAGFAQTGAIQGLVDGAVEFARANNIASDRVAFLSIGPHVVGVSEADLWGSGHFGNAGADLAAAIDAPEITSSDLAVIVSDGQPTSRAPSHAACSLLGAEDVSGLAPRLEAALSAGRGIWLVLEQAAFDGAFYLNCHTLPPGVAAALAHRRVRCTSECKYPYRDHRALLSIVQAASGVADAGSRYVAGYLARHAGAIAIRLHAAASDRAAPSQVRVEVIGEQGTAALPVSGSPGAWQIELACPARDAGARICVTARSATRDPSHALVELGGIRTTVRPDRDGDLRELREGEVLDARHLQRMQAWSYAACGPAWGRFSELATVSAGVSSPPVSPACAAGPGEVASAAAIACGCLYHGGDGRHRELLELTQAYSILPAASDWIAPFAATETNWFDEPDRIKGLAVLLGRIQEFWRDRVGSKIETVGRIQLIVTPPPR